MFSCFSIFDLSSVLVLCLLCFLCYVKLLINMVHLSSCLCLHELVTRLVHTGSCFCFRFPCYVSAAKLRAWSKAQHLGGVVSHMSISSRPSQSRVYESKFQSFSRTREQEVHSARKHQALSTLAVSSEYLGLYNLQDALRRFRHPRNTSWVWHTCLGVGNVVVKLGRKSLATRWGGYWMSQCTCWL